MWVKCKGKQYMTWQCVGQLLQYSCLENPMDGGAWWAAVHGVAKSRTWLSNFTFTFHFHELEKEMATHSSVLAWRIPGTEEPSGLPSMGSHSRIRLKQLSSSSSRAVKRSYRQNCNFSLWALIRGSIKKGSRREQHGSSVTHITPTQVYTAW